jgi:uncharacterized metal-binding protein YceD (DUF177 family)
MEPYRYIQPEFSRIVDVERLGEAEELHEIEATADERAALAERFGLVALESLTASLRLRRARGGAVRVTGQFSADVVQTCVVTLEPVPSHIEETFRLLYVPEEALAQRKEVLTPHEEEEMPEPLVGNAIDLGEAVAQQLGVALNPYPRAPGASLEASNGPEREGTAPGAAATGPFAALAGLKKKRKH